MTKAKDPAGLSLRLVAAKRLQAVLKGEHFAPLQAGDLADGRDRALANRLITTALRRHGQINAMLGELLEKGMPPRSGTFEAVLRLSLAQLVFLPDIGAHSALFLAVEAIKRDSKARHLSGLMNAVLRRAQGNSARFALLDDTLLLPETTRQKWESAYGTEAVGRFTDALIDGAPLDLTLREVDPDVIEALGATQLAGPSVRLETRDRPVDALPFFEDGRWWVQDVASAIPARLIKAQAGGSVLDLCAAPGGKTAQLCQSGYSVTALDSDATRLERLKANMERLGFSPLVLEGDAAKFAAPEPFDGIVLDAPCSATGTFRRHPEVLWQRSAADIAGRVQLQRSLFANAVRLLSPGGSLVYCVCSLEPEEGEAVAEWALAALSGIEADPIAPGELPGLEMTINARGEVRALPSMAPGGVAGGMDGFFVARFRRTS
ncbi:16S rRNA (cytosine967-C5)-methyltransferase [Devosia crocina]|uniref:16S rRNA (Cytosine967-C5)-methyltransferase n=1 Tax=Devosia crocina TaxID=429728 RepID=A0A1I7NS51_9HYPH|nr:RsmB/NOP family class I SAM-dependent RNA methyltransferase [Devosia crocina]SFV37493.1 16S rRNA (cytosine967-C5)-methyltransferase [Devosia crocina]